ncbi:hypothetical protein swp_1878 [Shewanella piezotolerans WP3]|uniref:Uncharacterized protein n=1 Tax=Shewanella piezotolerans (strain WP3 / JCM 13877) TaxID=225849 RepID=B8CLI8_SHEPW|nr:hypothetical protein swp_1878 [Shewanella piezotolerans WP3]
MASNTLLGPGVIVIVAQNIAADTINVNSESISISKLYCTHTIIDTISFTGA